MKDKDWEMEHFADLDDFGMIRDHFQLSKVHPDGSRTIYPFIGMLKVKNHTPDSYLNEETHYTDSEYKVMMGKAMDRVTDK